MKSTHSVRGVNQHRDKGEEYTRVHYNRTMYLGPIGDSYPFFFFLREWPDYAAITSSHIFVPSCFQCREDLRKVLTAAILK